MGLDQKFPARFVNGLVQRFARAFLQILRAAFRCACISFGPNKRVGRAAMETETSRRKRTPTPREPRRPLIISEELFRGVLIKERKLEDRVSRELTKRSNAETAGTFVIGLHVHPEPTPVGAEGRRPIGSLDLPELHSRQKRGSIDDPIKRGLDVIGSLALLVVLSPVF